jgi:molecular chaperone DnaK
MTPHGQPLNIEMMFTRKLLEQLTAKLVDRSLQICAQVLVDAGMSSSEVADVLLVGGQTRMPLIQERLTRFFGKPPSKGVHPDEAVAIGAALYAHSLEDDSNLRVQLLDVIPMAIGIEAAGGGMHVVFPRNAPIPNARALAATTSNDDQTDVVVRIFQGDQPAVEHNELLGEFTFAGLSPGPAGSANMDITFEVNVEGILTASARDPRTGREMRTTVRVTSA